MIREHYDPREKPLTRADFEWLLHIVDRLQDAVVVGRLHEVAEIDEREMIGWLDDLTFSMEEIIRELDGA